jgi:hypothetical protein
MVSRLWLELFFLIVHLQPRLHFAPPHMTEGEGSGADINLENHTS